MKGGTRGVKTFVKSFVNKNTSSGTPTPPLMFSQHPIAPLKRIFQINLKDISYLKFQLLCTSYFLTPRDSRGPMLLHSHVPLTIFEGRLIYYTILDPSLPRNIDAQWLET